MEENNFPITNWSEDDKPREKLMLKGKSALSDAELIAILIGSGSRNESAVGLSKRILASVDNNLNALGKLTLSQLMNFKGIGEAKAISIMAAMELGRRRRAEDAVELKKPVAEATVLPCALNFENSAERSCYATAAREATRWSSSRNARIIASSTSVAYQGDRMTSKAPFVMA